MAIDVVRQHGAPGYDPPRRVPIEEYLRLSAEFPGTYEYHRGLMYPRFYPPGSHEAMAGGTRARTPA